MSRSANYLQGVAALALLVSPALAESPKRANVDAAIKAAAPDILKDLHERKYQNVGVLKFFVADSDGVMRDNVGPLNRTLADRLEVALTLLLNDDDKLGIIVGASDAVAKSGNKRANHRTESGRKALFTIGRKPDGEPTGMSPFSVPWKPNVKVLPDAFLTGEATIAKDHRTVAVKVQLFDKETPAKLVTLREFTAAIDPRTLLETGVTFATKRGADFTEALAMVDKSAPEPADKIETLQKKANEALSLLKDAPVQLEILYDGVAQNVTADAGDKYTTNVLLRVPSPKEGTEVSFRLKNPTNEVYGVVLRVNGRNSIYEQRQDPVSCYKWVLEPMKSVTVTGFQVNDKEYQAFKVLSPEKSKQEYGMYGDNAGTFDFVLFRGVPKPESALVKLDADAETAAISRGAMTTKGEPPATDLRSFKAQLKREGVETTNASRSAGMIGTGGNVGKNAVKQVEFFPSPLPVLSTTIRYYSLEK